MAARRLPGPRSFPLQALSTQPSPVQLQPATVSAWRFASQVPSAAWHHRLSYHRIDCATDNTFAQRPPIRGIRQLRFCLLRAGDLLGQVSGQFVPVYGAFVEYSLCDPFFLKTSGLWTHIKHGPKKWGQARRVRWCVPLVRWLCQYISGYESVIQNKYVQN